MCPKALGDDVTRSDAHPSFPGVGATAGKGRVLCEPLWGPRGQSGIWEGLPGEAVPEQSWGWGRGGREGELGRESSGLQELEALGPSVCWVRKSRTQSSFSVWMTLSLGLGLVSHE